MLPGALTLLAAVLLVAALVRWALADAGRRGRPGWAVALLVVAAPVIGWLVWLALRPAPLDPWRREPPPGDHDSPGHFALVLCLALAWYNTGTIWTGQRVIYPLKAYVGPAEYSTYDAQYANLIQLPIVTTFALLLVATALLLWLRPPEIPEWSVWTGAALEAFAVWSSVAREIPLQVRMGREGFSPALNAELLGANWPRTAAVTLHALLLAWMALRAMPRGLLRGNSRWSL
ncbi:MAG TPA: hypothetical protein VFU46_04080 [Gemmatimonadales bacterium]|nr:hypothetical protein [Gemmatimonadales bacterium]